MGNSSSQHQRSQQAASIAEVAPTVVPEQLQEPDEPRPKQLSERQKELLRETWHELEDNIAKVGVITFIRSEVRMLPAVSIQINVFIDMKVLKIYLEQLYQLQDCVNEETITWPPMYMSSMRHRTGNRFTVSSMGSLFETHPDVQQVFMPFKGIELEDLKHSKQLRAHALRVMAFVQKAVARLHEPDKLESLLHELGKKHYSYGAKQKYVDLIGPQFILAIQPSLEYRWSPELQEAWVRLFQIMAYVMKSAMELEQHRSGAE